VQAAVNAARDGATITVAGVCRGPVAVGVPPAPGGCPPDGLQPDDLTSTLRGGSADEEIVKVTASTNVTVRFLNLVDGRSAGVEQKNSRDGHTVCNCVTRDAEGIEIHGGQNHEVAQNLVFRNAGNGIRLRSGMEPSRRNTVSRNLVEDNAGDGIVSEDSRDNTVTDNTSRRNGGSGIRLDDATAHRVADNDTTANHVCAITLRAANDNVVDRNRDGGAAPAASPACCASGDRNSGANVPPACR
jgi:parallel beta-helix repeat protein